VRTWDRLRREARATMVWRGHAPKRISNYSMRPNRLTGIINCQRCDAWVMIDTNPPANGIDIGGPGVAITCKS
jgi:hypothetical protein